MAYSSSFSKSIFVVIFIADKIRQEQFEFLSTRTIAETLNIPKPTLVKILNSLTQSGLVETKEGKQGGIRLLKQPAEITILDIFDSVERGKALFSTSFDLSAQGKRPDKAQTIIADILSSAENGMKKELSAMTIEQILIDMGR